MSLTRSISQSEVADLMQCPARWSFAHGHLAGHPIRPMHTALRLREGRAWGAAVQAWHTRVEGEANLDPIVRAHAALVDSLMDDQAFMERNGQAVDEEEFNTTAEKLEAALIQYVATSQRLNLVGSEVQLEMAHEDGWTYRCHLDGVHMDEDGYLWVVEFKLRDPGNFTPLEVVQLWRQVRWYALALDGYGDNAGADIVRGVIVDERLNGAPKPVRLNKDRHVSAVQSCMLEEYLAACDGDPRYGSLVTEPNEKTVAQLTAKVWQQRHAVLFTASEMHEALLELESAADLIGLYDGGRLRPIRNPSPRNCGYCPFNAICPDPSDERLRDSLYVPAQVAQPH